MRQEDEQLMSGYFDSAPGFFYTLVQDRDGGYAMPFASAGMRDLFGVEPGEVAQDIAPFVAVVHPDDSGTIFREIEASARSLACCQFEFRIAHPQKGGRWIAAHSRPQSVSDGGVRWAGFMHDITEHKRMEDKLLTREREFQSLAENLPDNIARWDTAGRILFSNPTHQRTVGKPIAELIGMTHSEVFPDGRYTPVDMAIAQVVETGQPVLFVRQPVPFENGETQIHDVSLVPERDEQGRVISVLGLGRDMTDIYRMQETVAAREQAFRSLAESSPDSIIRYDLEQRILYLNNGLVRDLGLASADEVLGRRPIEVWPDGRFAAVDAASKRVIESGSRETLELVWSEDSGNLRIGQILVVPENGVDGRVIGTLAFGRDISAIKDMQRQLTQFFSNFPGFAYSYRMTPDGHGSFPFASPGIEKLYGLTPADVMDDSARLHALAHPDDAPRIIDALVASARTMTPAHVEYRICRPGLPERWAEFRSCPVREADGSIVWHGIMVDIDERKRAAEALEESERRMARYFASTPGYFQMTELRADGSYAVPFASDGIVDLFGLKPDDVKENVAALAALNHPDDTEIVFCKAVESARDLTPYQVEYRIFHPQKGLRWIECIGSPERLADGGTRWYGFMHDITERKQAGEQLIASQKMLADAQKIAQLGSWDWDVVADRVEWSEMAYEIYTPDQRPVELGFGDFTSSLHPDDLERVIAAVQSAFERDTPFDLDHRVVSASRGVRTVHAHGKVFRDADGKPIRMVGTVQDITERKQAEIALKERFDQITELNEHLEVSARNLEEQAVELEASQEQLKQTEAWYRGIIRSAPEGMVVVNERGVIMLVNAQLEAMFGYERGELTGTRVEALLPQALRDNHADQRREYFASGIERRDAMVGKDLLGCRKDGSEFPVDVSLSRLPEIDGMGSAVCASVRDISARRVMESAREAALAEALRLAQLRSAFMAQMSHELRTPLNGILGYAQNLLLQVESLDEKQISGLRIIQNSGEHLLTLINGILDHAAIEADKFELVPGDIEMEIFLGAIIGMIRIRAEQKNLIFACEVDDDLPAVVRGDAQRLRQVLLNLLANAVKFTDFGQVTLRVNYIAPSRLRFAVQDSGVGIAADQREKIFMPFEQIGELSRRAGGNGLGLAISRKLVRLMGGDIGVESEPGVGSTLSFEIEMERVQSGASSVNAAALSGQAATQVALATPLLLAPPRQELETLHAMALRGSMRNVMQYAEQLAETDARYQPFVDQLRQLAKGFQTKALVNLIAAYRDGRE